MCSATNILVPSTGTALAEAEATHSCMPFSHVCCSMLSAAACRSLLTLALAAAAAYQRQRIAACLFDIFAAYALAAACRNCLTSALAAAAAYQRQRTAACLF
jgi:hypothetical protein